MIAKRPSTITNTAPSIEDGDLVSVEWVTFAERRRAQAVYAQMMNLSGNLDVGVVVSIEEIGKFFIALVMFPNGLIRINATRLRVISSVRR